MKSKRLSLIYWVAVMAIGLTAAHGCRHADPQSAGREARSLSFEEAVAQSRVSLRPFGVGPISRDALIPTQRSEIAQVRSFESGATEVPAGATIIVPVALKSATGVIAQEDRPRFRVTVTGSESEAVLLDLVGVDDFAVDSWTTFRVPVPESVGSPATFRFEIEPSAAPDPVASTARAVSMWGVPRLVAESPASRPNVLFVVFDTLRADHTQPYGYERPTTPFLAQLAKKGTLVEEFVATYPSTLASHWSMFSGRFPAGHGVYPGTPLSSPPGQTLAQHFQTAGYRTAAFTEGGFVHSHFGFQRGFDSYHNGPGKRIRAFVANAEETFGHALRWLDEASDDPFFFFLHTYQVHEPYDPPERYRTQFVDDYRGRWKNSYPTLANIAINSGKIKLTERERDHIINLYDAQIRQLDDLFKQLWGELEERGILDNTIVVITSDHGEEFLEHGRVGHGTSLYDPALLVPMIAIAPGRIPAGARLGCQRSQVDVMPTLLELAGLEVPKGLDGRSMAGALRSGVCSRDSAAISELINPADDLGLDLPIASLRQDGWKLIRHIESGKLEAYELSDDPTETKSLAITAGRTELLATLDDYIQARPDHVREENDAVPVELRERLKALGYLP